MLSSKDTKQRTASDRRFLKRVNAVAVTKDEVLELARESGDLRPEHRDFEGLTITAIRLHPGNVEKVNALMYRFEALARLVESPVMRGWTYPTTPDGATWTSEPVFAATAVQPVILIDGKPSFEPESFSQKVLELAEAVEES